ncbi:MAG TPA: hypothetical protein VLA34_01945 [Candidatus Krumholzibacterium sp.]|nr:hypothetical protein [Candidatus Krumholzibacterium sp.]
MRNRPYGRPPRPGLKNPRQFIRSVAVLLVIALLVLAALTLLLSLTGCGKDPAKPASDDPCSGWGDGTIDVLMIGNSLTAYHNTNETIQELADSAGVDMKVEIALYLGHPLEMIVESTDVFDRIRREKWDYVVIQGSNYWIAFPDYHYVILPPVQTLADSIYANEPCTEIVFFLDWAPPDGVDLTSGEHLTFHEFNAMIRYGTLVFVEAHDFIAAPCGVAWDVVNTLDPSIVLHDPDGGHPGPNGAYLNACVYYSTFTKRSCVGIDVTRGLEQEDVELFQSVGSAVVLDSLETWNH